MKVRDLDRHRLSDDTMVMMMKIGRKYAVLRTSPTPFEDPGDSWDNLTLDQARAKMADIIRDDVMEIDG